ncbi:MAG TPA: tetratricopeptide repeat protein [Pyrinomonadaceae bacterium]|nr:tetratricopeptide repeat protein [Pyrinomonadaceae bacterium]
MRRKLQLMFFFICLGALGVHGQGIGDRNRAGDSEGKFTIQGRVYMPDGRPAANVKVNVENSDQPSQSYYTNADGTFQTGNVRAGNFTISATIPGMPTEREFLTIDRDGPAGRTFSVTLFLRVEGQKKGDFFSNNPLFKDVPKPALDKFKKGIEKLEKNDAKAAVLSFDEAIIAYPNFAAAYHQKGSAYLKENDLDKALEAFVKAISIKPDYVEAKFSVGYTQYLKKNFEVAAAVFDDVLKQQPEMAEASMYLGISLYNLKNIDAAEAGLKKAVSVKGGENLALAHLYLGQIYAQKKKNVDAVTELEKYLELLPKAPNADRIKSAIADLKKQG